MKKPITAIVLGAGHRAMVYADYSLSHPDELKIVGVADPDEYRRNMVCEKFGNIADVLVISSKIEMEISQIIDPDERKMFLEDLGLIESGLDKVIKTGYKTP